MLRFEQSGNRRPANRRQAVRRAAPLLAAALVGVAACSGGDTDDGASESATAATDDSTALVVTDTATSTPAGTSAPDTSAAEGSTPEASAPSSEPLIQSPTTTVADLPAYDFGTLSPIVEAFVAAEGLNGAGLIIVDEDHGVIHEDYWGEFDADRISLIASSSKMITAGVLLHLADQGLLDMDAPIADYVEWGAANPAITSAQLVSNSSGLPDLGAGLQIGSYICQYVAAGTMQGCAEQIFTTPDDDAVVVAPDTEYRYGGAQWQIAGAVAEAVSGKSWAELIEEIFVEPCGLETLAYNNHFTQSQVGSEGFSYPTMFDADPATLLATDNPNMEGGAYVTTGDYAKLLVMHLRGGMCGDTQVLTQAALDQAHADRTGDVYDSPTGYGMGWWVDRESGRLTDPGAYGAVPWLDLEDGYGAYLVMEADAGTGGRLAAQLYDPVDTAIATADS